MIAMTDVGAPERSTGRASVCESGVRIVHVRIRTLCAALVLSIIVPQSADAQGAMRARVEDDVVLAAQVQVDRLLYALQGADSATLGSLGDSIIRPAREATAALEARRMWKPGGAPTLWDLELVVVRTSVSAQRRRRVEVRASLQTTQQSRLVVLTYRIAPERWVLESQQGLRQFLMEIAPKSTVSAQ